jgi:hypothetical protein
MSIISFERTSTLTFWVSVEIFIRCYLSGDPSTATSTSYQIFKSFVPRFLGSCLLSFFFAFILQGQVELILNEVLFFFFAAPKS